MGPCIQIPDDIAVLIRSSDEKGSLALYASTRYLIILILLYCCSELM